MSDYKSLNTPPQYNSAVAVAPVGAPGTYLQPQPQSQEPIYAPQPYQPAPMPSPAATPPTPAPGVVVDVLPEMICTNSGNEQLYPLSAPIYNAMCQQFGGHNVRPIPDYIQDEKLRKAWLKRAENALLYFLFKKDKYRKETEKLVNTALCCQLCAFPSKLEQYSPCGVCCGESMLYCCLTWITIGAGRLSMYDGILASNSHGAMGSCCPICCGGIGFRQMLVKRLNNSGINYWEPWCCSCLRVSFCQPCVAIQTQNVIRYTYMKRYGKWQTMDKFYESANNTPQYVAYMKRCLEDTKHPYSRAQHTTHGRYSSQVKTIQDRELTPMIGAPVGDLFHEYYNPKASIAAHNAQWKGYHQIIME